MRLRMARNPVDLKDRSPDKTTLSIDESKKKKSVLDKAPA